MRLPHDWQELDYVELQRQSLALGYGLNRPAIAQEIFDYVRSTAVWSSQSVVRPSIEVFCTGVGPCGQMNALAGLMLELNGIRNRGLSGFDPQVRLDTGGFGGHSVIEIYNEVDACWSYFDPYLHLFTPGVSASKFSKDPIGEMMIGGSGSPRLLARQFMYRRYFDRLNRLPSISMVQLNGVELSWGLDWQLVEPDRVFLTDELFPEEITIHVRARYLLTAGQIPVHRTQSEARASPADVTASPWSQASFVVRPRELLGIE